MSLDGENKTGKKKVIVGIIVSLHLWQIRIIQLCVCVWLCLLDCKPAHEAHRPAEDTLQLPSVVWLFLFFPSEVVLKVRALLKGSCAAVGLAARPRLFLTFLMMGF